MESFLEGFLVLDASIVTRQVRRANLTDFTWLSINRTGIVKGGCNVFKACLSRELLEDSIVDQ